MVALHGDSVFDSVITGSEKAIVFPQLSEKVGVAGSVASEAQLTLDPPFINTDIKLDLPQESVTFNRMTIFPTFEGDVYVVGLVVVLENVPPPSTDH